MCRNLYGSEKMCIFYIYEYVCMNVHIEITFQYYIEKRDILISIVFCILFDIWISYLSIVKIYLFITF